MWILDEQKPTDNANENSKNKSKAKAYYLTSRDGKQQVIIGRSLKSNVHITFKDDTSVSREHAVLMMRDSRLFLRDTSRYGTAVNEQVYEKGHTDVEIHDGDVIRFGVYHSIVRVSRRDFIACASNLRKETKNQVIKMIQAIGGEFVSHWSGRCSYLVMDSITVTAKMLLALINGANIVTPMFFQAILNRPTLDSPLPAPFEFLPPRAVSATQTTQTQSEETYFPEEGRKQIFNGTTVMFLTRIQHANYGAIIEAGGGISVSDEHSKWIVRPNTEWRHALQSMDTAHLVVVEPSGSASAYRGSDSVLWAKRSKELEAAGVTVCGEGEIATSVLRNQGLIQLHTLSLAQTTSTSDSMLGFGEGEGLSLQSVVPDFGLKDQRVADADAEKRRLEEEAAVERKRKEEEAEKKKKEEAEKKKKRKKPEAETEVEVEAEEEKEKEKEEDKDARAPKRQRVAAVNESGMVVKVMEGGGGGGEGEGRVYGYVQMGNSGAREGGRGRGRGGKRFKKNPVGRLKHSHSSGEAEGELAVEPSASAAHTLVPHRISEEDGGLGVSMSMELEEEEREREMVRRAADDMMNAPLNPLPSVSVSAAGAGRGRGRGRGRGVVTTSIQELLMSQNNASGHKEKDKEKDVGMFDMPAPAVAPNTTASTTTAPLKAPSRRRRR